MTHFLTIFIPHFWKPRNVTKCIKLMWHYNKVFIEVFKQRKLTCNMEITFIAKDFADALFNSMWSLTNLKIQDGGQVIWWSRRSWSTYFLTVQTVPFKNKQCRLTNCKVWKKCFWLTFPWNGPNTSIMRFLFENVWCDMIVM